MVLSLAEAKWIYRTLTGIYIPAIHRAGFFARLKILIETADAEDRNYVNGGR